MKQISDSKYIKQAIANVTQLEISKINENSGIDLTENWDSLTNMQILLEIERLLKINFKPEELLDLNSYKTILTAVQNKKLND